MRVATIIVAHKNAGQLKRLLTALSHEQVDCYIHLNKATDLRDFAHLASLPRVRFIEKRLLVYWASYRFTEAILQSIREILATGIAYDYINVLSGQDYPLKPAAAIQAFLAARAGTSFLAYEREGSAWWAQAMGRVERYHTTYFNFRGQYRLQNIANRLLPRRRFPLPYTLYGGPNAAWWILRRDCAAYLLDFLDRHPEVSNFSRFTWGCDEFLIPTILLNSPLREGIVNNNYRYIDWSAGGAHPKLLTMADADRLAHSDCLFARKFDDEQDAEILDFVDQTLLAQTPASLAHSATPAPPPGPKTAS